jgi:hypothetical protein
MAKFVRFNSLSLFFVAIFLVTLVAQSLVGVHEYNEEATAHDRPEISWSRYVRTSEFGAAVLENWQSEWLQFFLFILATVWLVQQGSPESKALDQAGLESDEEQKIGRHAEKRSPSWAKLGDWRTRLYENSLMVAFALIFFLSWFAQSVTGWNEYNNDQEEHGDPTVSWATYLTRPAFWERTLQNWQSEFLAVGTMAVFAIYLRQRGSPESKPVGAAHDETGSTG